MDSKVFSASVNSESADGAPDHFFRSSVRTSTATSLAMKRLLQHDFVRSCNCLAFGLCKASRSSVRWVGGVELVDDRVYHDGLLVYCYSGVGRDSHPVVYVKVSEL